MGCCDFRYWSCVLLLSIVLYIRCITCPIRRLHVHIYIFKRRFYNHILMDYTDDFYFVDDQPREDDVELDYGAVSAGGGRILTESEIEKGRDEANREQTAAAKKRAGYALRKAEERLPYYLSLANDGDNGDMVDVLDQTILVVPHADVMKALDLIRVTRAEIKGLKQAKLVEAADMVDTYAHNLYGLSKAIGHVEGKPADDPFWRNLAMFHSLVDSVIENGKGRDEIERALYALPENIQVIYMRDHPDKRSDFDIHEPGAKRAITGKMLDAVDDDSRLSQIDQPADGTTAETVLAPKIKHFVKSMTKTHKAAPTDKKDAIMSHKMPDGVTGVYQHLTDLVASHAADGPASAAPVAPAPRPKKAAPKASRAPKSGNSKRPREEDDDFVF